MQYVDVGGYKISKYTVGTVQLGMEYGIANKNGKPDRAKSNEILRTAVDAGINSFDTALLYGESEVVLGNFFSSGACSEKKPVLTTKFKIAPEEKPDDKAVEKQIYESIGKSLERLKVRKIPIYMLHDPKDMTLYGDVVPKTMERLKREGLIELAAVSVYTGKEVEELLKYDVYDGIQIPMNIFDHRLIKTGALRRLHQANKAVFVRSIFLQGLFFMKPGELTGNLTDAGEPLKLLANLAEREGMDIARLALTYILSMEAVTSLVIGAETPEQVKDNILRMEKPCLSEKAKAEAGRLFENMPEHILNPGRWKK